MLWHLSSCMLNKGQSLEPKPNIRPSAYLCTYPYVHLSLCSFVPHFCFPREDQDSIQNSLCTTATIIRWAHYFPRFRFAFSIHAHHSCISLPHHEAADGAHILKAQLLEHHLRGCEKVGRGDGCIGVVNGIRFERLHTNDETQHPSSCIWGEVRDRKATGTRSHKRCEHHT